MAIKGIGLGWIVVKDFAQSRDFFKKLGLTLKSEAEEYKWAEFSGPEGALLGLCEESPETGDLKAGSNAVLTITVDDIVKTKAAFEKLGVTFVGDIIEVPGHVKMASFVDLDGNMFQIVQVLYTK